MSLLTTQFIQALGSIEPTEDDKTNAPLAHDEVREILSADSVLSAWGLNPVLIGSYKRHVSIRRMKDVDLFGRVSELPDDVSPSDLLDEFDRVLTAGFGADRVVRQTRSFQIAFPEFDGLYVDAVPARPWTAPSGQGVWQLPQRGTDAWQATNPERLAELSSELNAAFGEKYVPVVKLLRQTRRSLMGKRKPGGLTIEVAAVLAFQSGDVAGTTIGELYVSALRKVGALLHEAFVLGSGLDDPTLDDEKLTIRGDDASKWALAEAFVTAGERAQNALDSNDKCAAAKVFREILGKAVDDDGAQDFVFPMPDDCNLDGTAKDFARVRPGDPQVAGGNRRFG
ncbi:nucleotidyltransferase [Tsukamurella tyrosinosolvens]|uniref:nucleotidyltransferase domain-containing protein n=1 Tax=Tsukamurella tyrosinosolvens TaxID=57704 RepID=UPI001CE18C12|nr:nucleotidyltransferase [Tsukamurella tyrosinosolvens]MCA4997291.1 nucleotidyltransferase [Tsukamurella tyrosinosolvens]